MRLLLDEMYPAALVAGLEAVGIEATTVAALRLAAVAAISYERLDDRGALPRHLFLRILAFSKKFSPAKSVVSS